VQLGIGLITGLMVLHAGSPCDSPFQSRARIVEEATGGFPSCLKDAGHPLKSQARDPLLGSGPHDLGWGVAEPRFISDEGDGTSNIFCVTWSSWGAPTVYAYGYGEIFGPNFTRPIVRIELRASDLGHCDKGTPLAYVRLYMREPSRPGGPLGNWFPAYGGTKGNDCWPRTW
jgi:hypothetical protein